jgi:hypothetical protein
MANVIRGMVSLNKKRYEEGGFNLDLTYVTDRIVGKGAPELSKSETHRV